MRMPFVRGSTAVGSFPATQISQPRRDASWTSMNAGGRESLSAPPTLSFPPTKRPACKLAGSRPALSMIEIPLDRGAESLQPVVAQRGPELERAKAAGKFDRLFEKREAFHGVRTELF